MPKTANKVQFHRPGNGIVRVGANVMTVARIETLYELIAARQAGDEVSIPTQAKGLAAGGEVALIQWLITWAQGPYGLALRTFAESKGDVQIDRLSRRLYGQVAGLCCSTAKAIDGVTDITQTLRDKALIRLKALQGPKPVTASRGQTLEILCIDHLGMSAPKSLYTSDFPGMETVRSRKNFFDVVSMILDVTAHGTYRRSIAYESIEAIAEMLYEVFRNTDDHARTTLEGDQLRYSVRGLQARKHDLLPDALEEIVGDFAPLKSFCARLKPEGESSQVHLLELSVFDSGVGFAQSWLGVPLDSISLDKEFEAVVACFLRGSSKIDRGFGEGLPHVVRLLHRQRGFLRLRTGRLSLYSDMGADKLDSGKPHFELQRWLPPSTKQLSADARIAYLDTPSLYAIVASINEQLHSFDSNRPLILADNFRSYLGLKKYDFRRVTESVVLISASSSGSLANELVKLAGLGERPFGVEAG